MAALNKLADAASGTAAQDVNATGSDMLIDRKKSQMSAQSKKSGTVEV
jgi:hypothetical protein